MASLIHKITRNSASSLRLLSSTINNPPLLLRNPASPLFPQTLVDSANPDPTPHVLGLSGRDNPNSSQSMVFFPSFPFGYRFNPIASTEFENFGEAETRDIEFDDAGKLWADSVKKKRKRKMNKHKYQKLRKRLRRKA